MAVWGRNMLYKSMGWIESKNKNVAFRRWKHPLNINNKLKYNIMKRGNFNVDVPNNLHYVTTIDKLTGNIVSNI
jgi:hypothetical protein